MLKSMVFDFLSKDRRILAFDRRLLALDRTLLAMERRLLAVDRRLLAMEDKMLAIERRLLAMVDELLSKVSISSTVVEKPTKAAPELVRLLDVYKMLSGKEEGMVGEKKVVNFIVVRNFLLMNADASYAYNLENKQRLIIFFEK